MFQAINDAISNITILQRFFAHTPIATVSFISVDARVRARVCVGVRMDGVLGE